MAEKGPDGGGQPEGEDVNPLPSDDVGFIPRRTPPAEDRHATTDGSVNTS